MFNFLQDCRTATLHLEQARGRTLARWPRVLLWAHLLRCSKCRRYARQSRLLEQLARQRPAPKAASLSNDARRRLQRALQEAGY